MTRKTLLEIICSICLATILVMLGLGRLAFLLPALDWFSHFPATALIGSLILTACLLTIRSWRFCWLGLATILFSAMLMVAPYTGSSSIPADITGSNLVVATGNVLVSNGRLDEIVESLPDADVLGLIETSTSWGRILPSLKERWPSQWSDLRDNPFGLAVLTRTPVRSSEWIMLTPGAFPALRIEIEVDGIAVTIITVHAMSPQSPHMLGMRDAQFRTLSELIRAIPGNLILMGDLNASPWSSRLLNLMHETGLRSSRASMGLSGVRSGTWPAWLPSLMRLPIDHCLVRGNIIPLATRTFSMPGADHLGIEVELAVYQENEDTRPAKPTRWESMSPWAMFWRSVRDDRPMSD